MTIHKEGYTSLALTVLLIFIVNAIVHYYFPDTEWLKWLVYIFSFALFIIILQFFRSPNRVWGNNDKHIICPADGKVVVIEETEECL